MATPKTWWFKTTAIICFVHNSAIWSEVPHCCCTRCQLRGSAGGWRICLRVGSFPWLQAVSWRLSPIPLHVASVQPRLPHSMDAVFQRWVFQERDLHTSCTAFDNLAGSHIASLLSYLPFSTSPDNQRPVQVPGQGTWTSSLDRGGGWQSSKGHVGWEMWWLF